MPDEFYKDKAWELLMEEIKEIKKKQEAMALDIAAIKNKMAWVFGMAAGITFVFNLGWEWIVNHWKK